MDHADEAQGQVGGEADDQSEPRRAFVVFVFVVVLLHQGGDVVVVQLLVDLRFGGDGAGDRPHRRDASFVVGLDRPDEAAGVEHQGDGRGGDHEAGDERAQAGGRGADEEGRDALQQVAQRAAEAGRQRPARRHGEGGERQRGHQRAGDPANRGPARQPGRQGEDGAPGPDHRRQQEQRGAEPEKLGQEVGDDRAGEAQNVADGVVGGVAEARVVDRPGGEAGGGHRRQSQNRQPDHGADVAAQDVADRAAAGQGEWRSIG